MSLNSETKSADQFFDTAQYIQYLVKENKRLTELVSTLVRQAAEKDEMEKAKRKAVQAEGIERAKRAGVKFGRPAKPLPPNFDAVYHLWKSGEISRLEAARRVNMPEGTFRYRSDHYEEA